MEFLHFIGRFHPLVLHLPIGFLLMAAILEWIQRRTPQNGMQAAVGIALLATMISAITAAVFGYWLSLEDGYAGELLDWHKWLGIGFAASTIVLYRLHQLRSKKPEQKSYFLPAMVASLLLMSAAGHYGGMLTHGTDFLTEKAPAILGGSSQTAEAQIDLSELDSAVVFVNFIQPILKSKCTSCHNAGKVKGDLMLHSIEGIRKGGENGAVLVAHQLDQSPLVQRIKLPMEDEEHMPPDGKKQITDEELALLEWWISEGADFDKKVAELEQPEAIRTMLEAKVTPPSGIYALNISPLSERKLKDMKNQGIPLYAVSRKSPFVEVDFSGNQALTKEILQQLKKSREQLTKLDLGRSNCDDDMLSAVAKLPHLTHLNLGNSLVTSRGIQYLENLEYLEYLNLFGTAVNDSALAIIGKLPNLQRLFLWNTGVSESGIAKLQQAHPKLMIDNGREDDPTFGSARMKPPQIVAEQEMFNDTVSVELQFNFAGADLYYTLDGSAPDSTSIRYEGPFSLREGRTVKAIAHKPGWEVSEVSEKQFLKVKYQAKVVNLTQPHERYSGKGAATLTDFTKGTVSFQDGAWLGYQKQHLEATLDLGKVTEVSKVTVSALENAGSWIFFPKGLKTWISKDGKAYQPVANLNYDAPTEPTDPTLKNFAAPFSPAMARFVKVKVESNLVNPSWHPAPGEPCWIFIDEIIVE